MNPIPPPLQPPPGGGSSFLPSQPPNPPPPSSLETALSELTSLLDFVAITLGSLPTPIAAASDTFVPCPFNANHRVPPSSLFSHYLKCPSPLSLPHTFHYPLTLRSSTTPTPISPTLPSDSSDLTVSLSGYITCYAPASSFFYQNCPGPVTVNPSTQPPLAFNLPKVLYVECADFNEDASLNGAMYFPIDFIQFLPSEIWAIRSEIEAWGGALPVRYSSRILLAVLKLRDCKLLHLHDWIIANSPRYGVIIDSPMRDHVVVLVRLCLKVIVREAFELVGSKRSDGESRKEENVFSGLSNRSFECPTLVKVMMWLAVQFSILYGEVNGKYLAVDVLKECISNSASRASFFPLEGEDAELVDGEKDDEDEEKPPRSTVSMDDTQRDERENIESETLWNSVVFISKVSAAVAALHERSLIEEKIMASKNSRPLPAYQRNVEHAHLSMLADEERKRRPDYRPVIEYDGFLRQRANNQDANKVKTREELLAEERDYKRRRMSYRGKKVKRNPLEVTRDIIQEFMEEIRYAGGIGGTSMIVERTEALSSENLDRHASATLLSGLRANSETPQENRGRSVDYRKDLHSLHSGDFKDDNQQPSQDSSWFDGRKYPNRNVESVIYDRDDQSRSWDGRQISSHTREQEHVRERQDLASLQRRNEWHDAKYYKRSSDEHERRTHKRGRDGYERTSHRRERDDDNWELEDRQRRKTDTASQERDEDKGWHADRRKSKTKNRSSSYHRESHEFEDRYDPAESRY